MFGLLTDYPVHAFNWDIHLPGNPAFAQAGQQTDKALVGGVNRGATLLGDEPALVAAEVQAAMAGRRLLVSAGCSISPRTPEANLWAAKRALSSD